MDTLFPQRLDPEDVCRFGHQLQPGSVSVNVKTLDERGREKVEVKLLRRHAVPQSLTRPHGHFQTGKPVEGCELCETGPGYHD